MVDVVLKYACVCGGGGERVETCQMPFDPVCRMMNGEFDRHQRGEEEIGCYSIALLR